MITEKEIEEGIEECIKKHMTVRPLDYSDGFFDAVEWFKKKLIEKLQQERIEAFHAGYKSNEPITQCLHPKEFQIETKIANFPFTEIRCLKCKKVL